MYRNTYLALIFAAACGAEETPGLQIAASDRAILEEAARVAIYFYDGAAQCTPLRMQVPRMRAVLGPYFVNLTPELQQNGATFMTTEVPAGTYAVLADAEDKMNTIVATGCAEGQQVFDQQRSPITLTLSRNP